MVQIQINYKSGISMTVECESAKASKMGGDLTSIEVTDAVPRALFFGIDNIESIWEL